MIMIAETAFEMTVLIISETLASNHFVTIFCKTIKQTLMIFLEVFNKETSDRICSRNFIVKHKHLIASTNAFILFATMDVGNP